MFLYSDYNLSAKTYHGGIICIEYIQFTNNRRINFKKIISNLKIDFKTNITDIAISQIIVEKKSLIHASSYDNVISELIKLHNEQWLDIDNFGLFNAKEIRRKSYPLCLVEGRVPKIINLDVCLKLNVQLDQTNQFFIPLFRQIAYLILTNIENSICDSYGAFEDKLLFKNNKLIELVSKTKILENNISLDNQFISFIKEQINSLIDSGAINRLANNLSSMSYKMNPNKTVDLQNNYEDTLFIIGSKGWRKAATKKNIEFLISNSSLEIKLGKITKNISLLPGRS